MPSQTCLNSETKKKPTLTRTWLEDYQGITRLGLETETGSVISSIGQKNIFATTDVTRS